MKSVKFEITPTNHILIAAKVNDVDGLFMIDTGASGTCIDSAAVDKFSLKTNQTDRKAVGVDSSEINVTISHQNTLQFGEVTTSDYSVVITDFSGINEALTSSGCDAIDGIIGGDLLCSAKAIIDYYNQKLIFTL